MPGCAPAPLCPCRRAPGGGLCGGTDGRTVRPQRTGGQGGLRVAGGPLTPPPGRPPCGRALGRRECPERPLHEGRAGGGREAGRGRHYRCWPAAGWSAFALPTTSPSSWRTWPAGIPTSWGRDRRQRESRAGGPQRQGEQPGAPPRGGKAWREPRSSGWPGAQGRGVAGPRSGRRAPGRQTSPFRPRAPLRVSGTLTEEPPS